MRTNVDPNTDDAFEQRAKEKDAQREELFGTGAADSQSAKDYVRQQVIEKPKKIKVGKPGFSPRF